MIVNVYVVLPEASTGVVPDNNPEVEFKLTPVGKVDPAFNE